MKKNMTDIQYNEICLTSEDEHLSISEDVSNLIKNIDKPRGVETTNGNQKEII